MEQDIIQPFTGKDSSFDGEVCILKRTASSFSNLTQISEDFDEVSNMFVFLYPLNMYGILAYINSEIDGDL